VKEVMSTTNYNLIREELLKWVQTLNDSKLLNLLNSIKLSASQSNKDWWNELNEDQQQDISMGLKDLAEDRIISSKEFWKQLRTDDQAY
jgi:hypothetical protein